jgi:serine/threonine protein kinase/tetratricopeptide (TPR) repeat protein
MLGTTISHYRILEKLGAGGMGVVYKAQDIRLGRFVALKFLPDNYADGHQLRDRFQREARAASALNHPSICTIYDIGEADGRVFMAMEYLDGVTLKDLAVVGPMELNRLVDIAVQVLDGLEAAHAQNVIHRDIKPANIFVTSTGRAKILDFGLAKIKAPNRARALEGGEEEPASGSGDYQTSGGGALSTMPYMSPEQALGQPLDARSDLFSFGVTLYEMASGKMPFQGETTGVLLLSIVQDTPTPAMQLNPEIPPELRRIIDKCLEKDRELRYQHASAIRSDLKRLRGDSLALSSGSSGVVGSKAIDIPSKKIGTAAQVPSSPVPVVSQVSETEPSRRVTWKVWVSLATLLVTLGIGGLFYWRSHKKVVLTERDTVVLADFANSTGDSVFDDPLKTALMVDLNQSPYVNVLSENKVAAALKLMTKPPDTKLTPEVARDVCQRASGKAYIAGSIASLGTEYVIGLKAVNCQDGDTLAQQLVTVPGKEKVLDALDQATAKLRGQLGESLASVQRFDVPLEEATTSSLEALTAFTLGRKAMSAEGEKAAISYFKRATALDPNFALAYAGLGTAYANLRESDLAKENYQKAYDLRSRVSTREQYAISAYYYNDVTGDLEKANQTYELYAKADPRNWVPHNNLGGNYAALGKWQNALAEVREAVRLNPDSGIALGALMEYECRMGRYEDAKSTYQLAASRGLDYSDLHYYRYGVAFLEGDAAEMQRQRDWAAGKSGREDVLLSTQSDTEAFSGHLTKARELSRRATESAHNAGEDETAAKRELNDAIREVEFGYPLQARSEVASALGLSSTRSTRVLAAAVLARAGDIEHAQKMAHDLQEQNPSNTKIIGYWLPTIRAAIELNRHNPAKAIEILDEAAPYELGMPGPQPELGALLYPVYLRGQAYLALHQGSAARAEFQKYQDHRGAAINSVLAGLSPLGLARAYKLQGDAAKAHAAYQNFLVHWTDADPDIPVLKQAKAEYIKT